MAAQIECKFIERYTFFSCNGFRFFDREHILQQPVYCSVWWCGTGKYLYAFAVA